MFQANALTHPRLRFLGAWLLAVFMMAGTAAAQEVPGWEKIAGHGMDGHNLTGALKISPAECAVRCNADSRCLGFDYYRNTGQCLLNDADGRTAPGALKKNPPVDFYQRAMTDTHGNPAPPFNPNQPDWRVSDSYCQSYAKTAVDQNTYNQQHRCGFSGGRWTSDYNGHFRWCKAVAPGASKNEQKIRYDALVQCQQANAKMDNICRSYAQTAVAQNKYNVDHRCGFSGRRWTGDYNGHYNWCRTVSESVSGAETRARDTDIRTCQKTGGRQPAGQCINGFLAIPSAGITARNKWIRSGHTEASCRAACNGQPWCISFELSTAGTCHLAEVNRSTPGIKFNTPANFPWTYYERCDGRGGGNTDQPWTSQAGRTCFDRWVRDMEARLNNNQGSAQYNGVKPFRINQYGLIVFRGARSISAPDDWNASDVKGNRFAFLWKHMRSTAPYWYFRDTARDPRDRVQVYELRYFVQQCMAGRL